MTVEWQLFLGSIAAIILLNQWLTIRHLRRRVDHWAAWRDDLMAITQDHHDRGNGAENP